MFCERLNGKCRLRFVLLAVISSVCYATDDNQEFRANTSFSFKLSDAWKMGLAQKFRFRDGEHFEHNSIVSFKYKAADWLDLGLGFEQLHQKDSSNDWKRENRPFIETTLKKDLWGLQWSDRNRLEYRQRENSQDVFRYHNELKMHIPYDLFGLPLQPYVADEVNIQEETGLNRNRLIAGLVWEINETLDVDFFYWFQKDKTSSDGWQDYNIIGAELKFSF